MKAQEEALLQVEESGQMQIHGFEFDPVVTLGVRGKKDKDLMGLLEGFEVVSTKRGGEATIHNPGQLVIYPVVPIRKMKMGVSDYVCLLTKATKSFLKSFEIDSITKEEPGLYTDKGKIALFGIQVKRGITQHGIAINISNDLSCFEAIRVCGVSDQSMDRIENHSSNINLEESLFLWQEFLFNQL